MRHLFFLAAIALAGAAVSAASKQPGKTSEVDGKPIIPGPAVRAKPLVEIKDLKFYQCALEKDKRPCVVVTGWIIPHLPNKKYVVTLDVETFEVCGPTIRLQRRAAIGVTVERPAPDIATSFEGLGEAFLSKESHGEDARPAVPYYEVRSTITLYKPPKLPPIKGDALEKEP